MTVESLEAGSFYVKRKMKSIERRKLNVFREKLTEVSIYSILSKLQHTRLLLNTLQLKRKKLTLFLEDLTEVDTLKESKGLYKSIKKN